jgi:outer membrane lipoprotein-sorting protein
MVRSLVRENNMPLCCSLSSPQKDAVQAQTASAMKKPAFQIVFLVIVSLCFIPAGSAYIPSAEQILEPFLKAYRGVHTIKISMKNTVYLDPYRKAEISEQLLIQEGGLFRSERISPQGNTVLIQDGRKAYTMGAETERSGGRRIETVFPTIFFQKSVVDLLNALSHLGVDAQTVSIDRMERKVVFVVGKDLGQEPGSRLWIDRERVLPLRFIGVGISGGEAVVLRAEYLDYRQVGKDLWFPGKIEYYTNDALSAVSVLHNISVNEKLSETLFKIPEGGAAIFPVTDFLNIKE